jgi:inner membrane transporter RhtA
MLLQERRASRTDRVPPHAYFLVSAVFHYLGPSFAVLLFSSVSVLGVAWFRIASAAVVFAVWRRPWHVLAEMHACFYMAIARLPLATVGAIEFLGPILLAALGVRTLRNSAAFVLAVGGVWLLTDVRFGGEPLGFVFAFANCGFFILYVILGHRIA